MSANSREGAERFRGNLTAFEKEVSVKVMGYATGSSGFPWLRIAVTISLGVIAAYLAHIFA